MGVGIMALIVLVKHLSETGRGCATTPRTCLNLCILFEATTFTVAVATTPIIMSLMLILIKEKKICVWFILY
jgi:hypothetical protein